MMVRSITNSIYGKDEFHFATQQGCSGMEISMKVLVMLGSSRENSVSYKAAMKLIEGARESGHEVVVHNVQNMNIHGCMGCGSCRQNGTDCVIQDDMGKYYDEIRECDALVVTSPNYYSQISGPMITFMNRNYCLTDKNRQPRIPEGIKLFGIFAQGAPEKYEKYTETYDWYLSTFLSRKMVLSGKLVIGGDSDLSENGDIMKTAYEMGRML